MLLYIMLKIGIPISRNLNFELCYSEHFLKSPPPFYVRNTACLKREFLLFMTISSFPLRGQRIPWFVATFNRVCKIAKSDY